jgi:hypothetical protein
LAIVAQHFPPIQRNFLLPFIFSFEFDNSQQSTAHSSSPPIYGAGPTTSDSPRLKKIKQQGLEKKKKNRKQKRRKKQTIAKIQRIRVHNASSASRSVSPCCFDAGSCLQISEEKHEN